MMKIPNLSMTRYRRSRYWAVYNGTELLAVIVYRKGAETVINFINDLTTQYNTMSKKNTKKPAAAILDCKTVLIIDPSTKQKYRATLEINKTRMCRDTKGDWRVDEHVGFSLYMMVKRGIYKLANKRAKELFNEFYAAVPDKSILEKGSLTEYVNSRKDSDSEAASETSQESAVEEPAEQPQETEEAIWAQLDEERAEAEAEQASEMDDAIEEQQGEVEAEPQETPLEKALREAEPPANWIEACNIGNDPEKLAERAARGDIIAERNLNRLMVDKAAEAAAPAEQPAAPAPRTNTRKAVCQVILNGETEPQPIPADIELKPGVKLVRAYQGSTIEVLVEKSGFTYNGTWYPTLTHISWLVTPYKASGNTFFGLPVRKRNA